LKRLNVLIKGNVDLHDSLLYARVNGRVQWNGLNALLSEMRVDVVGRVRQEACARWDRSGLEGDVIPALLAERKLDLGAFDLQSQFRSTMLSQPMDVLVLSVQCEVTNELRRHRRGGFAFLPALVDTWPAEARQWLEDEFDVVPRCTVEESMRNLGALVAKVREASKAPVLVYNMSSVLPGEHIDSYRGFEASMSTRIKEYNLALLRFSQHHDVFIVDVDHAVARAGADRLQLDFMHYYREGYRVIAAEVVRVLENRGLLDG
jgi:lysophospholipase L1-like esterase